MPTFTPKLLSSSMTASGAAQIGTIGNLFLPPVPWPTDGTPLNISRTEELVGCSYEPSSVGQTLNPDTAHLCWRVSAFDTAGDVVRTPSGKKGVPVSPGVIYRAEAWIGPFTTGTSPVAALNARWFDSDGTFLSSTQVGANVNVNGTAGRMTFHTGTVTSPAGAAFCSLEWAYVSGTLGGAMFGGWTLLVESYLADAGAYGIIQSVMRSGTPLTAIYDPGLTASRTLSQVIQSQASGGKGYHYVLENGAAGFLTNVRMPIRYGASIIMYGTSGTCTVSYTEVTP